MQNYRETMAEKFDDDRRYFITTHDLRRTWASRLVNADVDGTVAPQWGGWNDLETVLDHYHGEATAAAQRCVPEKVDWL